MPMIKHPEKLGWTDWSTDTVVDVKYLAELYDSLIAVMSGMLYDDTYMPEDAYHELAEIADGVVESITRVSRKALKPRVGHEEEQPVTG